MIDIAKLTLEKNSLISDVNTHMVRQINALQKLVDNQGKNLVVIINGTSYLLKEYSIEEAKWNGDSLLLKFKDEPSCFSNYHVTLNIPENYTIIKEFENI